MGNVIDVRDVRDYRVYCTDAIWYGKILVSRPWMETWKGLLETVLKDPSFICQDMEPKHRDRNAYYLIHPSRLGRYVKVVARFSAKQEGFMISAFPADSGKQTEKVIWMPS